MGLRRNLTLLFFVFLIGVVAGFLVCFVLFSGIDFGVYRKMMGLEEMVLIFMRSVLISFLLLYGGSLLALGEIRVYRRMEMKAYERLGRPWDFLYSFLGRLDPNLKKLNSVFRTCYYVLSGFPVVGVFVTGSAIGFYLSLFRNSLGLFFDVLYPHVFIEIPVYLVCASLGLLIAGKTKGDILENNLEKIENNVKKSFRQFVYFWPLIIILLLVSAYLEVFI
jgi:hypothetical protein